MVWTRASFGGAKGALLGLVDQLLCLRFPNRLVPALVAQNSLPVARHNLVVWSCVVVAMRLGVGCLLSPAMSSIVVRDVPLAPLT